MNFRKLSLAVVAGAAVSCVGMDIASAQPNPGNAAPVPGRVYAFHTNAVEGCPSADWHIVVGPNNTLSGMVSTDDHKNIWRVTGTYGNGEGHLQGTNVATGKPGATNAKVQTDGRLALTMGGFVEGSACQGQVLTIPWVSSAPGGAG